MKRDLSLLALIGLLLLVVLLEFYFIKLVGDAVIATAQRVKYLEEEPSAKDVIHLLCDKEILDLDSCMNFK